MKRLLCWLEIDNLPLRWQVTVVAMLGFAGIYLVILPIIGALFFR